MKNMSHENKFFQAGRIDAIKSLSQHPINIFECPRYKSFSEVLKKAFSESAVFRSGEYDDKIYKYLEWVDEYGMGFDFELQQCLDHSFGNTNWINEYEFIFDKELAKCRMMAVTSKGFREDDEDEIGIPF